MTTPAPTPNRPDSLDGGALYDAVAIEHAAIYGYGIVSAHSTPADNTLVAEAMATHRRLREGGLALLADKSLGVPLPAAGYTLPFDVNNPDAAVKLAIRMEADAATAWRAVVEQATDEQVRAFGVDALTQCAVLAARWRKRLEEWPVTQAFPGGTE